MNNWVMISEMSNLPDPDLILATATLDDPFGSEDFYRADTVVKLLMKERENAKQKRNNQP